MPNREKVTKHFEHLLNAAKGNYQDFVDLTVDVGEEILALLKQEAVEPIRGEDMDTSSACWWYVCPSCRIAIDYQDRFCRHCGQALKWKEKEKTKDKPERRIFFDR